MYVNQKQGKKEKIGTCIQKMEGAKEGMSGEMGGGESGWK